MFFSQAIWSAWQHTANICFDKNHLNFTFLTFISICIQFSLSFLTRSWEWEKLTLRSEKSRGEVSKGWNATPQVKSPWDGSCMCIIYEISLLMILFMHVHSNFIRFTFDIDSQWEFVDIYDNDWIMQFLSFFIDIHPRIWFFVVKILTKFSHKFNLRLSSFNSCSHSCTFCH